MIRTITMTFEADTVALAKATAALFESTPFGRCIEIAAGDNPMCEAKRPDERETTVEEFETAFALLWKPAP